MKISQWMALLATLVSSAIQAQTCGSNEYCVGPVTGPFAYQAADGNLPAGQGSTEARAIANYQQNVWDAFSNISQVCSVTLTDNLPAVPPPELGIGSMQEGNYSAALAGVGQYLAASWYLSVISAADRIR